MADEDDRPADPAYHVPQVRGIARDAPQRVGGGHRVVRGAQPFDDTVPTRRLGERAVHENNGGLRIGHDTRSLTP
ncbi:hypothetical protein GCM10027614_79900 [Micromonospora vulcania]